VGSVWRLAFGDAARRKRRLQPLPCLEQQPLPRPYVLNSKSDFLQKRGRGLAQRYAEVRKGMGLKIVGYAADAIPQMRVAKINQEAEPKIL
jgi:hypothetical protein